MSGRPFFGRGATADFGGWSNETPRRIALIPRSLAEVRATILGGAIPEALTSVLLTHAEMAIIDSGDEEAIRAMWRRRREL